jgi:peptidoglycan/LPS O-acetylase OafA/YrhL
VSFFYILSGFVLSWSMRPGDTPRAFYRRRFARVYPNHLLTWVAAVPVVLYVGAVFTPAIALASLFLVQAYIPNDAYVFGMDSPDWSLSCEAFFYALFPFVIVVALRLGRARIPAMLAIVATTMALPAISAVLPAAHRVWFTYEFPPSRFLEFAVGVLLACEVRSGRWPRVPVWAAVTLAAFAYVLASSPSHFYPGPNATLAIPAAVTVIPFVLLIGAAANADITGRATLFGHHWMVRLGEWSFAFYLVHVLWLDVFEQAFGSHFGGTGGKIAETVIMFGLSVGTAALVYTFYERPIERRLRHSTRRSVLALDEPMAGISPGASETQS